MFWRLTLREIAVILKGTAARLDRQHNSNAWLAWHIEALSRTKKLPKLEKMQTKRKPVKKRRMTPEEMLSIAHLWTAATRL